MLLSYSNDICRTAVGTGQGSISASQLIYTYHSHTRSPPSGIAQPEFPKWSILASGFSCKYNCIDESTFANTLVSARVLFFHPKQDSHIGGGGRRSMCFFPHTADTATPTKLFESDRASETCNKRTGEEVNSSAFPLEGSMPAHTADRFTYYNKNSGP